MGEVLSVVKDELAKPGKEDKQEASEALELLTAMARDKLELFEYKVQQQKRDCDIPIDKIIAKRQQIFAKISKDEGHLKSAIQSIMGNLCKGMFVSALQDAIPEVIDSVLGQFSGSKSEKEFFKLVSGPNGGLLRVDFYAFAYKFQSQSLIDACEKVIINSMIISTVDISKLDASTIRGVVLEQYGNLDEKHLQQITDHLIEIHTEDSKNIVKK